MAFKLHHHHHHQHQQQSESFRNFVPVDNNQIPAPIAFFDPPNPSYVHVMGLAPPDGGGSSGGWEPPQRKEQDFLEKSQLTSVDFGSAAAVSTGLGLSIDDGRGGVSSGNSPLSLLPMMDAGLGRELYRMEAEMDRFIRLQGEQLRQSILENFQAKQFQTLVSLEEKVQRMIQEKEAEVDDINKKNMELEELMRQLSVEAGAWQQRAKQNESLIATLKLNIQQVHALGRDNKEGCGDSEVDDTASCCNGGAIDFQLLCKENNNIKESITCKVCRANEVCMLLLPCRHLCLCKDCESKLSFCPLCQSSKFIGMEIYM